jgi:hypothetical protein
MSIPGVSITVEDGALGSVPASTSGFQVKMGTCQNATASVAASVKVASTTSGDGVTYTANKTGAGGNAISVTHTTGSATEAPVITVIGNSINVQIKASTTENSDIVTAIAGNAQASALVTAVATGASDLAIAAAQTFLTGGVTGTINSLFTETDPTQALTDLGYGPLTEALVHDLLVAGGSCGAMPLNTSISSITSVVSHTGSGLATVAVSGTPLDFYNVVVAITTAGALGAAQFQYSLDNGLTYSQLYAAPSGGTFVIPDTGLTLTLSVSGGNFVKGDLYAFQTAPAGSNITDVTNGINALLALPTAWSWVHVVGPAQTSAAAAALAAAVEVLMEGAASTNFKYGFCVVECPTDTDANIEAAFGSTGTLYRTMVCAGTETIISSLLGDEPIRPSGISVTARMALTPPSEDPGRVARGSLPGVVAIQRDENATPALDALSFTTLRTIPGQSGFFITSGHMFVPQSSDFWLSQNRRVMDIACTTAYAALLQFLNSTLAVNKTNGTISNAQASTIENYVNSQLNAVLVAPGDAVASSVVVNRTNNVLSSKQLLVTVRVTPNGYAKQITATLAFNNPALQALAPG